MDTYKKNCERNPLVHRVHGSYTATRAIQFSFVAVIEVNVLYLNTRPHYPIFLRFRKATLFRGPTTTSLCSRVAAEPVFTAHAAPAFPFPNLQSKQPRHQAY